MKKQFTLVLIIGAVALLSGCASQKGIGKNIEAYCTSFGEVCPQNETQCDFCGITKASSSASCHSKEFCDNSPSFPVSFEQRLKQYIQKNFSNGYYCDVLPGHKYFFDVSSAPPQTSGDYFVVFVIGGYVPTELGNLTNCGGGGETLIVHDDGSAISLIKKFSEFENMGKRPDAVLKLLNDLQSTAYAQAKLYFHLDETKIRDQSCPLDFCNKLWYTAPDAEQDPNNSDITIYTTIPPAGSAPGRWTMYFSGDHTMTQIDRECSDDGWCTSTGTRNIINKNTISYPLAGSPERRGRFEIVDIAGQVLKIRYLYE